MRDTIRRLELYSFYDHTGLERHLESMAAKGWMVEKTEPLWRYRRCEPRQVQFTVTFYPRASMFDPEPTEGELDFQAFCRETGWKLACSSAQLQVFYNEDLNAVPIDTDPMTEVETLHRTAKRAYFPSLFVLLAVCLLQFYMLISDLITRPLYRLSSSLWTCSTALYILVTVLVMAELVGYFSWRRRALKAARRGEFLATKGHRRLQIVVLVLACAAVLFLLVSLALEANSVILASFVLMALCMAGVAALTWGIRALFRRLKAPRNLNRVLTFGIPFLVGTFGTCFLIFLFVSGVSNGQIPLGKDAGTETYQFGGISWKLYHDELPLVLKDLTDADTEDYIRERDGDESVFLGDFEYEQYPRWDAPDRSELPRLEYEIVSVKLPFFYDFCVNAKLREYKAGDWEWVPADPAPWGADRAWVLTDAQTGERWDQYLLCGEDRIVDIALTWTPDEGQRRTVGEKLL